MWNTEKFEGRLLEICLHIYWFLSIYVFISIFNLVVLDVLFAHHVALVSTTDLELWEPDFDVTCVQTTCLFEVFQTGFYIIVHSLICNLTWLVWNQNYEINVVFN